jgi:hypothetical protein
MPDERPVKREINLYRLSQRIRRDCIVKYILHQF